MEEKKDHILIATTKGFCTGCGAELVERPWNNETKYDFDTGNPYKLYVYTCPENFNQPK